MAKARPPKKGRDMPPETRAEKWNLDGVRNQSRTERYISASRGFGSKSGPQNGTEVTAKNMHLASIVCQVA